MKIFLCNLWLSFTIFPTTTTMNLASELSLSQSRCQLYLMSPTVKASLSSPSAHTTEGISKQGKKKEWQGKEKYVICAVRKSPAWICRNYLNWGEFTRMSAKMHCKNLQIIQIKFGEISSICIPEARVARQASDNPRFCNESESSNLKNIKKYYDKSIRFWFKRLNTQNISIHMHSAIALQPILELVHNSQPRDQQK